MFTSRGVSHRDLAIYFRSLALMFQSGIPLANALTLVPSQTENPRLESVAREVASAVKVGTSFGRAVEAHPDLFAEIHRKMIRISELTGSLPSILEKIAVHEEQAHTSGLKVKGAMIYPLWIMASCFLFVVFVPPWLFRELCGVIERSGVELPLITRLMMLVSRMLANPIFYLMVLVVGVAGGLALREAFKSKAFRLWLTGAGLELWGVGPVLQALATARFARALGVMVEVGVPLHVALQLAAEASGNALLADKAPRARQGLLDGKTVPACLEGLDFFSPVLIQSVQVGIDTGALDLVLFKVAELFEVELEHRTTILFAALEPLAMLGMGLVVGGTIVATMLPLLEIVRTL